MTTAVRRIATQVLPRLLAAIALLVLLAAPVAPSAWGEPGPEAFLQLRIDSVSPDIVTTTSDPVVTVKGVAINVGDRPVRDVVVRLERAPEVAASTSLRTELTGNVDQFEAVGDFVTVATELNRGQNASFTLSFPLRSAMDPSLRITEPGVYPLLVNVNGTPDYGAPARLDDARFLLPVLGVPPNTGRDATESAEPAADDLNAAVPPDTSQPVRLTMLWPLADRPRLAPGAPGGTTPVRLTDDELARSLAPGGRLDTLLAAVDFTTGPTVDPGGQITPALCLAVDPDLLVTVNAMTAGYVVDAAPDTGPGTPTVPGTGQQAALDWLNRLKALAQRICVTSTSYAHASLDALQRIGDQGLGAIATVGAGDIVDQILGIRSTRGAAVLGDEKLTGPAVSLLSAQSPAVAIAAADLAAQDPNTGAAQTADLTPVRYTPTVVAAPFDPAVGAALAGVGDGPDVPSYLDQSLAVPLGHVSAVARRQDALGALLWPSLDPATPSRTQILMPPLMWSPQPDAAQAILSAVATTIRARLAVPRPLAALIAETAATPQEPVQPLPGGTSGVRVDDSVISGIRSTSSRLWGLTGAMTTDTRTGLTGIQYTAPLREDMLRALSQSVPPDTRNEWAQQHLGIVTDTVDALFGAVTIVNPGGSYTLATEHSPLPLALRNDLAVPIRVRLAVDAPPGMSVTDLGVIELPPGYLPLHVPIEVHFTQRFAVDVALTTADGLPLGEPVRLSLHSNAYGKVLFVITLSAGAVLVALVGRRLWHRFRGQRDPADLDADLEAGPHPNAGPRPDPAPGTPHGTGHRPPGAGTDPLDVAMAYDTAAEHSQPRGDA